MTGSTERRSRTGHGAVAATAITIFIYAIFYLKAFATPQQSAAPQQAANALPHTSSLYVSSPLTHGALGDEAVNYWNDLSETEARELVCVSGPGPFDIYTNMIRSHGCWRQSRILVLFQQAKQRSTIPISGL
jgi:hypothetical protein